MNMVIVSVIMFSVRIWLVNGVVVIMFRVSMMILVERMKLVWIVFFILFFFYVIMFIWVLVSVLWCLVWCLVLLLEE